MAGGLDRRDSDCAQGQECQILPSAAAQEKLVNQGAQLCRKTLRDSISFYKICNVGGCAERLRKT